MLLYFIIVYYIFYNLFYILFTVYFNLLRLVIYYYDVKLLVHKMIICFGPFVRKIVINVNAVKFSAKKTMKISVKINFIVQSDVHPIQKFLAQTGNCPMR